MHRQTDGQTDRQKQTDHNNPLLSSSVNYLITGLHKKVTQTNLPNFMGQGYLLKINLIGLSGSMSLLIIGISNSCS